MPKLAWIWILCLFALIVSELHNNISLANLFIAILFSSLLFISRQSNIIALIAILSGHYYLFYELNYVLYFLTKDYLQTGTIVGNIILNIIGLIGNFTALLCVVYREDIVNYTCELLKVRPLLYEPVRADALQFSLYKYVFLINTLVTVYLAYIGVVYFLEKQSLEKLIIKDKFVALSDLHVHLLVYVDLISVLIMALTVHVSLSVKIQSKPTINSWRN